MNKQLIRRIGLGVLVSVMVATSTAVAVLPGGLIPWIVFGVSASLLLTYLLTQYVAPAWSHLMSQQLVFHTARGSSPAVLTRFLLVGASNNPSFKAIEAGLGAYFALLEMTQSPDTSQLSQLKGNPEIVAWGLLTIAILRQDKTQVMDLLRRRVPLAPRVEIDGNREMTPIAAYYSLPYPLVKDDQIWNALEMKLLKEVPAKTNIGILSPVLLAIKNGYPLATVKNLIERGEAINNEPFIKLARAPKDLTDFCYGESALHWAIERVRTNPKEAEALVELLVQQPGIYLNPIAHNKGVDGISWGGLTPLLSAVHLNAVSLVERLVSAGTPVDVPPDCEDLVPVIPPYLPRTKKGGRGFDPIVPFYQGVTTQLVPVQAAVDHKAMDCLRYLLQQGANPNAHERPTEMFLHPYPALFSAIYPGMLPYVKCLVEESRAAGNPVQLERISDMQMLYDSQGNRLYSDTNFDKSPYVTAWGLADNGANNLLNQGEEAQQYREIADYLLSQGAKPLRPEGVIKPHYRWYTMPGFAQFAESSAAPAPPLEFKVETAIKDFVTTCGHPYQFLKLTSEATQEQIGKSYRQLARDCHPDKHQGKPLEEQERKEEEFKCLTQAYEILSNVQQRQWLDYYYDYRPGQTPTARPKTFSY